MILWVKSRSDVRDSICTANAVDPVTKIDRARFYIRIAL
jgi:hypothetical protein